jgi:hypothetical protein
MHRTDALLEKYASNSALALDRQALTAPIFYHHTPLAHAYHQPAQAIHHRQAHIGLQISTAKPTLAPICLACPVH